MRFRRYGWIGSLLVLALVASPLAAQEGGDAPRQGRQGRQARQGRQMRPGMGFSGRRGFAGISQLRLLSIEQVQKELKVTDEQKEKVAKVQADLREQMRGDYSGLRDLSREERTKKMQELRQKQQKMAAAAEKKLKKILDKKQVQRLSQIQVQQQGARALAEKPLATKLKLTEEQTAKIKAAIEKGREDQMKLFQEMRGSGGARPDREAFAKIMEKRQEIQKGVDAAVLKVLTKEQNEEYTKLKGAPFKLDRQAMMRGRGGRTGGRGTNARRRQPQGDV